MQDVSTAGEQLGLEGCRSKLVCEPFRTYDHLHKPLEAQFRPTGPAWCFFCKICKTQGTQSCSKTWALSCRARRTAGSCSVTSWRQQSNWKSAEPHRNLGISKFLSVWSRSTSFPMSCCQEARRRNMKVHWASLCLQHVGANVGCWESLIQRTVQMFWIAFFQVRRKRVFILLTRAGYTLPDIILDENCFSSLVENKRVLFALHCMQDHCMMHVPANAEWNPRSKVPLSQWLAHSQNVEDKARLDSMGNIVVPIQATKALSVLAQMMHAEQQS